MTDRKPPRLAANESATLLALLQYQRDSIARKVSGLGPEQANASPVDSGTSLLWLINHVADAEAIWILGSFAGLSVEVGDAAHEPNIDAALARYRRVQRSADTVISEAASLDQTCATFDDRSEVNLRWILAHLLEETARHAGHADILRELTDGATGR